MVHWRNVGHKTVGFFLEPLAKLSISANRVSWIGLFLSILVSLLLRMKFILLGNSLLFLALLLDGLDGFIARKKKQASFDGLVVDVSCDRFSEFIIFYPSIILTGFATLNCFLTVLRLKNKKVFILPLRHLFFIINVLGLLIGFEYLSWFF